MFGGAAVCGLLGGACLVTAGVAALALVMPLWLAALLMGVFLVGITAAMYHVGREKAKDIDPVPQRTVESIRDNLQWAKHRTT
jgi:hypothetical protein